jgi:DNA-binding response OmpR family regulator
MAAIERIKGKRILIVDDEKDVLETLVDILNECKIDTALSFDEAKQLLESNDYDVAILDIMGVNGFELLGIAKKRKIPALMLTAHGLSEENLKKSAEEGAAYYAPKEKMSEIDVFVSDVIEASMKKKSAWDRVFYRLESFYDKQFGGTDWREKEKDFWDKKFKRMAGL